MMSKIYKINVTVGMRFSNKKYKSIFGYPAEQWNAMTSDEQRNELDMYAQNTIANFINVDAWIEKE